jgi:citrate synthase
MQNKAKKIMASAFIVDPADIHDGLTLGSIREWDSLGHMRLVVAIEEFLGKTLDPHEVVAIRSLADVSRLLDAGDYQLTVNHGAKE